MMERINELHGGHRERLRQRLLDAGPDSLEPHELLEFVLCYALPRQDVNALAHALLEHFGDVRTVFNVGEEELLAVEGVGLYAAQWLRLCGECAACCISLPTARKQTINFRQIFSICREQIKQHTAPCCVQLCMDELGNLLYQRAICHTYKWAEPEILREALDDVFCLHARHVILVLIAGKRVSYPSNYDMDRLREYVHTLNLANVSLLDMVICGSTGITSMRRMDMIPSQERVSRFLSVREDYESSLPAPDELEKIVLF